MLENVTKHTHTHTKEWKYFRICQEVRIINTRRLNVRWAETYPKDYLFCARSLLRVSLTLMSQQRQLEEEGTVLHYSLMIKLCNIVHFFRANLHWGISITSLYDSPTNWCSVRRRGKAMLLLTPETVSLYLRDSRWYLKHNFINYWLLLDS
jgi:hypothetical protein